MESEESTVDSCCDEDNLKACHEKLIEQKEVRITQLEARVKSLEMELEKAQNKLLQKEREESDVAKAQQELLQELKTRKAVQYELICTGQQVCEMQEKIYEQEKRIQKLTACMKSPAARPRVVTASQVQPLPSPIARQFSDNCDGLGRLVEGSTTYDSPMTARSISSASCISTPSERFGSKESTGYRTPRVSVPSIIRPATYNVQSPSSGATTPLSARIRSNFAHTPSTPILQSVLVPSHCVGMQSPVWSPPKATVVQSVQSPQGSLTRLR